ncbi:MAG TPA: hypothetical protein VLA11_10080 [Woeseiaceae bacterium]|nr:hypothetical protein [Woeseiaceae bacterium]
MNRQGAARMEDFLSGGAGRMSREGLERLLANALEQSGPQDESGGPLSFWSPATRPRGARRAPA